MKHTLTQLNARDMAVILSLFEGATLLVMGIFLAVTPVSVNGAVYHHAILRVEHWPTIPREASLVLSLFGSRAYVAKWYAPNLKLVFIGFRDMGVLAERLRRRCEVDGSDYRDKMVKNERYVAINIESQYDFVVYNDTTPEDCVAQIMSLIKER